MDRPARPDGATPGERVRFCMRCGAMVAFDDRVCPSCGEADPLPAEASATPDPGVDVVACDNCDRMRAATLQFCPECGREAPGAWPSAPSVPVHEPAPAGQLVALSVALALLAPVAAFLGLALALRH